MHPNKTLSLFLIILVLGANFISRCHANTHQVVSVHFIAETCASHECSRGPESHSCSQKTCNHGICADQTIMSAFRTSQFNHTIFIAASLQPVFMVSVLPELTSKSFPVCDIPALLPNRTIVLRI
jgi:hypothetical protein